MMNTTKSIKESISYLMQSHFPNSAPTFGPFSRDKRNETIIKGCSAEELENSFINEFNVTLAINSFGSNKTGGPDGFKPIALQQFIKNPIALKRLTTLFRAIIKLGYTPQKWCNSKVIFLQKPSRDNYEEVKSFRPISLLSFFYKTVERLVLWEIENTSLKLKSAQYNSMTSFN